MAALLGTVASGFAVVSLAIQVAETIQKLKNFHSLMQSAPTDILFAIEELETLSTVLEDVDRSMQEHVFLDPRVKTAVMRSWRLCKVGTDGLVALVLKLEQGFGKGKMRAKYKVAMKRGDLDDFRKKIDSAKTTMQLANQIYYQATQNQRWESLEKDVLDLRRSHERNHTIIEREVVQIRALVVETPRLRGPLSQKLLGTVEAANYEEEARDDDKDSLETHSRTRPLQIRHRRCRLKTRDGRTFLSGLLSIALSAGEHDTATSVSFGLPGWIYARRFELIVTKSRQGWDQSFRSYRTVSYDAKVFDYCVQGDVAGLQRLFSSGQASPFEVDPDGRTPLHYAALYAQPDACKLLLQSGADVNKRTFWRGELGQHFQFTPALAALRDNMPLGERYRGWAHYSTPLHFLLATGDMLSTKGRRVWDTGYCYSSSESSISQDFETAVKVLATSGADLMLEDQYRQTAFHIYKGPVSSLDWLLREGEWDMKTMCEQDQHDIMFCQLLNRPSLANFFTLIRILPTGKTLQIFAQVSVYRSYYLHFLINSCVYYMEQGRPFPELDSVISDLVQAGANVHMIDGRGYTPLLYILLRESMGERRTNAHILQKWLEPMHRAGVDLVEYGRIENEMHDNDQTDWTFWVDIERNPADRNICCFELLELRMGERPEDFSLVFEDLYVSAGLAADFWEGIDGAAEEERTKRMPGRWLES